MQHPEREYMERAIEAAKYAASLGQYAIGAAVIGPKGEVVSTAYTTTHETNDPTAHGEINAIRAACKTIDSRYLIGCWLYTTLEPCPACTATAIWAKMEGIVFGATKEDAQAFSQREGDETFTWRQIDISSKDIVAKGDPKLNLEEGFMRKECCELFDLSRKN